MTRNYNSKGFSILAGLLLIVIIGAIGAVGYYVYTQNQPESVTNNPTTQTESAQDEEAPAVNNADDLEKTEQYLDSTDVDEQLDTSEIDGSLNE